jgi:hypothetical protein
VDGGVDGVLSKFQEEVDEEEALELTRGASYNAETVGEMVLALGSGTVEQRFVAHLKKCIVREQCKIGLVVDKMLLGCGDCFIAI